MPGGGVMSISESLFLGSQYHDVVIGQLDTHGGILSEIAVSDEVRLLSRSLANTERYLRDDIGIVSGLLLTRPESRPQALLHAPGSPEGSARSRVIVAGSTTLPDVRPIGELSLQEPFRWELIRLLESEPMEAGQAHPAEALIEDMLRRVGPIASVWLGSIYEEMRDRRPAIAADILRCIGRLPASLSRPWGQPLAKDGLYQSDEEVRDAAIRAFEMWGLPEGADILRDYLSDEPVAWLADYARGVIADLSR